MRWKGGIDYCFRANLKCMVVRDSSCTSFVRAVLCRVLVRRARRGEHESLIPQTLEELESDRELQELYDTIEKRGQLAMTREEEERRISSLKKVGVGSFKTMCQDQGVSELKRGVVKTLQLNIGLYCNQACRHCHVESSPKRTEMMSREVAAKCVQLMDANRHTLKVVDLTGGAPELCNEFRYLAKEAAVRGFEVIDRCNLTVLCEPGQEDLAEFLKEHKIRVVASLPCYSKSNVDSQRGGGVFERSIRGLQNLCDVGYGVPGSGLVLDLVYNPNGVFLAPPQSALEGAYRQELLEAYGIRFNNLLCLNNMPIKRWADELLRLYVLFVINQ